MGVKKEQTKIRRTFSLSADVCEKLNKLARKKYGNNYSMALGVIMNDYFSVTGISASIK